MPEATAQPYLRVRDVKSTMNSKTGLRDITCTFWAPDGNGGWKRSQESLVLVGTAGQQTAIHRAVPALARALVGHDLTYNQWNSAFGHWWSETTSALAAGTLDVSDIELPEWMG